MIAAGLDFRHRQQVVTVPLPGMVVRGRLQAAHYSTELRQMHLLLAPDEGAFICRPVNVVLPRLHLVDVRCGGPR